MNRGDRREPIFQDDADRERFLATLGEACARTGWQVHALCLMPNHFHLVVENSADQSGGGHEMVAGHLHLSELPATWAGESPDAERCIGRDCGHRDRHGQAVGDRKDANLMDCAMLEGDRPWFYGNSEREHDAARRPGKPLVVRLRSAVRQARSRWSFFAVPGVSAWSCPCKRLR